MHLEFEGGSSGASRCVHEHCVLGTEVQNQLTIYNERINIDMIMT